MGKGGDGMDITSSGTYAQVLGVTQNQSSQSNARIVDESDDVSIGRYEQSEVDQYNELRGSVLTDTEMQQNPPIVS